jgi:predicted amidophosphoribosyltransferase
MDAESCPRRARRNPPCAFALRHVDFAACYVYSPAGTGGVCERSRLLRTLLKEGDPYFIDRYVSRVHHAALNLAPLHAFFRGTDLMIPVPGSHADRSSREPRDRPNAAAHLAAALVRAGLGTSAWPGLRRIQTVPKSATAPPGGRPSVSLHYDSFAVERCPHTPRNILLVDDVITKGRTLLAAAARVHEAFPAARVRAFALLRTMGRAAGVPELIRPCVGKIRWRGGDAWREP